MPSLKKKYGCSISGPYCRRVGFSKGDLQKVKYNVFNASTSPNSRPFRMENPKDLLLLTECENGMGVLDHSLHQGHVLRTSSLVRILL